MGVTELDRACGGATVTFECRPGTQDADVVAEVWDDLTYGWTVDDMAGATVVDLGANIGAFSLWAAAAGADRVIAVEPEPGNFEALARHTRINFDVGARVIAVHAAAAPWPVHVHEQHGASSWTSPATAVEPASCPNRTLGELLASHAGNDVWLKVDIEGGEYALFAAAAEADLVRVARIAMEFHSGPAGQFGALVAKLAEYGRVSTIGRPSVGGLLWWTRY